MRNKNTFWIACSLTMLCAAAWIMANRPISAAASSAIPMPASIEIVKLVIVPADSTAVGVTTTVSELISLTPAASKRALMSKVSSLHWGGDTKVKFRAVQYLSNGVWRDVPSNWDQMQVLMASDKECPACSNVPDPRGDPGGFFGHSGCAGCGESN